MTTITIERELLEQAVESFVGYRREMRLMLGDEESEPCDAEKAIRAALAAPATAPAWHDAPTVPGVWICDEGDICYTWTAHNIEILDQFDPGDGLRWYGPIQEDKP